MITSPSREQSIDVVAKGCKAKLTKAYSNLSFQFKLKLIPTRTPRKFIPNGSGRHTNDFFIESAKQSADLYVNSFIH